LNREQPLRDLPPPREKLAQGKPHDSPAIPVLFQFLREFGGNLIEGGDMLILELDRHGDEAVFVFLVFRVPVTAVFVMFVGMIVWRTHISPRKKNPRRTVFSETLFL
jgi:hypothetical protein